MKPHLPGCAGKRPDRGHPLLQTLLGGSCLGAPVCLAFPWMPLRTLMSRGPYSLSPPILERPCGVFMTNTAAPGWFCNMSPAPGRPTHPPARWGQGRAPARCPPTPSTTQTSCTPCGNRGGTVILVPRSPPALSLPILDKVREGPRGQVGCMLGISAPKGTWGHRGNVQDTLLPSSSSAWQN